MMCYLPPSNLLFCNICVRKTEITVKFWCVCVCMRARDSALLAVKQNDIHYIFKFSNRINCYIILMRVAMLFRKFFFDTLSLSHNTERLSLYEYRVLHNAEYLAELTQEVA